MLTEEQIQRLAKKIADEHGYDEEECKEYVRFMANRSEVFDIFHPESKKNLEGEFFEELIQRSFLAGKEISKICRLIINSLA